MENSPAAEVAQARMFERLLELERAELQAQADGTESAGRSTDGATPILVRLDEIHRLLLALRGRFPHATAAILDG